VRNVPASLTLLRFLSRYCLGPSDLQCCITTGVPPPPPPPPPPPSSGCRYITRAEWGARAPNGVTYMSDMVPYVFVHHSAGSSCNSLSSCSAQMRGIQNYHMDSNGWNDIGYSFLMGGDGNLYEGRGYNVQGSHTSGYNSVGYGVCFIGDFTSLYPTDGAMQAYVRVVYDCLIPRGKIGGNYKLYGHRQTSATACPG
jgi:N-acetylmuramoyl-L-alanine amidase